MRCRKKKGRPKSKGVAVFIKDKAVELYQVRRMEVTWRADHQRQGFVGAEDFDSYIYICFEANVFLPLLPAFL